MKWKLKSGLRRKKSVCNVSLIICLLLLASCATYNTLSMEAREDLLRRNYSDSLLRLEKACKKAKKNRLLCLYDTGMIHYLSGSFEAAIKSWTQADELASQIDVVSLREQGASLVLDDNSIAYRGEHHEKILNSLYLGLSYLFQGKLEDALVECRRMHHKHKLLEQESQKKYKQNAFAKYLSGKMFESQGEFNEAFLYYREANDLSPGIPIIRKDLLRMASALNFRQEYETFRKRFGLSAPKIKRGMGELVVIFENGQSPEKISEEITTPAPGRMIKIVVPRFMSRSRRISHAVIRINGKAKGRTYLMNNIDLTAKQQLKDRVSIRAVKMVGRIVAKEVVAAGIAKATDNKLLGALVSFGLQAMQRADTRSWLTLPADLQAGSIWLEPGKYRPVLDFYASGGSYLFSVNNLSEVEIKPDAKKFIQWRAFE